MRRFVEGVDRGQTTLFPECLEDWIGEDNPVRVVDVFVEELDLAELGFGGVDPEATGRPSYHPSILLKLCIYGYLNRVQSSWRLEYEAGRNVEVMWLLCRLVPDHKTIADFRKDNGAAIRKVCAQFIALCRAMGLLTRAVQSSPLAPPARNDGSPDGNMSTFSKPFSAGSTSIRRRCASAARPSNIPSAPSRPGWEQPIS